MADRLLRALEFGSERGAVEVPADPCAIMLNGRDASAPCSGARLRTTALTRRQAELLAYLEASIRERGYPPTGRDMCARFGWRSPRAAFDVLESLRLKGRIRRTDRASRGLRVTEPLTSEERTRFGLPGIVVSVVPPRLCCACGATVFGVQRCPMCGAGMEVA